LNLEFWLNQCGDDVVYDTNRSCLVLRNKFNLNIGACSAATAAGDPYAGTPASPAGVTTTVMGPGKLIFKEGMWWWARCKVNVKLTESTNAISGVSATYDYDHFEDPVAISLAPLNACAPIEQTQVYFSGINSQDNNKNFTTCFF